jgi:hypothetical protein
MMISPLRWRLLVTGLACCKPRGSADEVQHQRLNRSELTKQLATVRASRNALLR